MAAVIYSNGSQECERMAQLLKSLGGEFLEYKLNHHFTQKGFEAEFGEQITAPQGRQSLLVFVREEPDQIPP